MNSGSATKEWSSYAGCCWCLAALPAWRRRGHGQHQSWHGCHSRGELARMRCSCLKAGGGKVCLPHSPIQHLGRQERRTPPRPPRAPAIACACSPVMSWHHVHARQPAQQLATHRALTCSCCFTGALPGIMMGRTGTCKERATKLKWDLSAWPRPYHTRAESCWPRGGMRTCVQPRGARLPDDPSLAPFPRHLLTSRLSDVTEMTHSGYVWSRKVVYECNYYVYTPRSRGDVRGRVQAT